jgi:MOSC domain-containing protein YiiM
MFQGQLAGICTGQIKNENLRGVDYAEIKVEAGLVGDRYFRSKDGGKPDQEITLIESEALEALARECGITLQPVQARRNLVTRGVPLNHLIGREFSVGEVRLRGIRLCEPCTHLESMTHKGVREGLLHRGGLRACVIKGGTIRVGDVVQGD